MMPWKYPYKNSLHFYVQVMGTIVTGAPQQRSEAGGMSGPNNAVSKQKKEKNLSGL